ncbi:MAG TPA: type II secretion system protein [Blastocatellia bacterium]|nr:type II secretion system protein [Blastocatellia bacterium]
MNRRPDISDFKSRAARGVTLLELIITMTVISIVVAGAVPLVKNTIKRQKEVELRRALREIRQAIDQYKTFCDRGGVSPLDHKPDDACYPTSLDMLVDGITPPNKIDKMRFLRRLPIDPMTNSTKWGTRAVQDDGDSAGGSENVFDVFTRSDGTALDGSRYKDW